MINYRLIYKAAKLVMDQHGSEADVFAGKRVIEMLSRGDPDRALRWARIRRAIEELSRGRCQGERLN